MHLSSLGRRGVFSTHAWHVQLSRAKELCILLTRGNKEKVRQKNFSIAPGYCYLAAAKEFKISFCRCIFSRNLWQTHFSLKCFLSHTHTNTDCQTFTHNLEWGERETPWPQAAGGGGFCFGRRSCRCLKNYDVGFSLSNKLLLWLPAICIGSVIPPGNMGQLQENSTLEKWVE